MELGNIRLNTSLNNSVNNSQDIERMKKLSEVSKQFAGWFIYEVFKKMDNTVPRSGFLKESFGEKWFREMLYQQYALSAAKKDLKNLSEMVYKSLGGKEIPQTNLDRKDANELAKYLKRATLGLSSKPMTNIFKSILEEE